MNKLRYNNQSIRLRSGHPGFSLIEVIVALGIFAILAAGIFNVATSSYRNFYGTGDKQAIAEFAQEGIEAARSIRNNSWQDMEDAISGNKGVAKAVEGYWEFSGDSNTQGALSRVIVVSNVERDANSEIVAFGGTEDPNTKKIVVTVSGSGIDDYALTTYFTNWSYKTWEQSDWSGVGDREFWSDLTMASSSYSNISTSTFGELALSQSAAPGVILGDWINFATTTDYTVAAWRPIRGFAESPDGNTLYIGGSINIDLVALDIEHIRDGIIDDIWTAIMDMEIYSMVLHPNGKYLYIGRYSFVQDAIAVEVIDLENPALPILDSETCDDPEGTSNMRIMDMAINEDASKLFAISMHGGFHSYTINADGTLDADIVGGGGDGNLIVPVFQPWGYTPHKMWLDESGATDYAYVTSDYSIRCLAKFDISTPTVVSYEYAYTGSEDCNGLEFIGNSGSGNTFAIVTQDSGSSLRIIRDNGTSFTEVDTYDPGATFHNDPGLIFDGDNTIIMYTGPGLDMVAYDVSNPDELVQVFSPDTSTFAASHTPWPHSYVKYIEKIGGFFVNDYIGAGISPAYIDFVPRPETRNIGTGYDYKRTIAIDSSSTKVIDGPHTDFPVLIGETQDYLKTETNGGNVKHDYGYDIIFTSDSAGTTILDFEIEKYSSSTGEFIAWVEVPSLSVDSNIYMFYGNDNIETTQERKVSTWNSAYKFVSHMNQWHELVDEQEDSTLFRNHLVAYNDATQASDGKIAYAYSYDGDGDYNSSSYTDDFGFVDEFTWSLWVRIDGVSASTINSLASVTGSRFYANEANPATFRAQVWDDLNTQYSLDTTSDVFYWGEWTKIDLVFDRPVTTLYRNGQSFDTYDSDYDLLNDTTGALMTGSIQSNMYWMNGKLDEVRLSNEARTAGWIETNYNTQNATSTFYSIGSEAVAGGYNTPGTLYSSILDIASTDKELRSITVEQDIPSGCSLQITAEVSNDITFPVAGITSEVYEDASVSYYTSSTSATLNGKRYLRYKVDATACNDNTETPILYGAKFNYR